MAETMTNQISSVPLVNYGRNAFVRDYTWKGTFDSGYLIPVFYDEVLPGDTKQLNTTFFGRLSTPFVPFLDNVYLDYHLFYVPNRLSWEHWNNFLGVRKNPKDSIDYLVPTITAGDDGFARGGYLDYLGVPPAVPNLKLSSITFYLNAINLIWNRWYRDENLQDEMPVDITDSPKTESMYPLLKRGKRFDYFTSCTTSPQKGAGVELPLGGTAPVIGNGMTLGLTNGTQNAGFTGVDYAGVSSYFGRTVGTYGKPVGTATTGAVVPGNNSWGVTKDPANSGLICDLTGATAATINSLRQAIALQQFLELDNRFGTRIQELMFGHFGVTVPNYLVDDPEYLGGSTVKLIVNPVTQTSSTDSTSPQGNLAAYATFAGSGTGFTKSFVEHGVVLGFVSVRTDLNYQQGVDRHFLRNTRYDYYWNKLAHLGDQAVYNKEIYAQGQNVKDGDDIVDDMVFGYNERYAEYRYKMNLITGKFRSSDPQSLDIWHLAQYFENLPKLNSEFIEENPPLERVLAVQNEPQILLDCYHDFTDIREVPMYGIPGLERI